MRILVTNDDGVEAPGIAALAGALARAGHDLLVAAPRLDSSGAAAAVGPRSGDEIDRAPVQLREHPDIPALGVDALPAFIVYAACRGAFGEPPELVCSGINRGRNVGGSVLHSGTVGAALTAAQLGRSALAISLQARGATLHYETAAGLAAGLVELLSGLRTGTVLNCNVPNRAPGELLGLRRASLARSGPILPPVPGAQSSRLASPGERAVPDSQSDDGLTLLGWATVTALVPVAEDLDPVTTGRLDESLGALPG